MKKLTPQEKKVSYSRSDKNIVEILKHEADKLVRSHNRVEIVSSPYRLTKDYVDNYSAIKWS